MLDQRILLVERDSETRRMLSHTLTGAGYSVEATADVEGARELLERRGYDLVIADGQLPASLVIDAAARFGRRTAVISDYMVEASAPRFERPSTMTRTIRPSELLPVVERHIGKPEPCT